MTGEEKCRVVMLDDYERLASQAPALEKLRSRADVTILRHRLETEEELRRAVEGAHALLLVRERTRFGDQQLALAPSLRLISQTGRGIAHLDLNAATRRGIAVSFTANDSGISTVELTFGLIFALLRRIPLIDRKMREERWPAIPGLLLEGKTLGVIGLGRIGKQVARIARAFEAKVLGSAKTNAAEKARSVGATPASLEALLRNSDIVTIHVPLNQETRGLIGEKEISLMKRGAFLVNTARGPIVSEPALVEALEKGHLGGVGLDVFDEEPLPSNHPLRRFENAILLSHRGYATVEVLRERYQAAVENILSFLDGKPVNLLNPEVLGK